MMTEHEQIEAIRENGGMSLGFNVECSECDFTEFIDCGTNEYEASLQLHINGWRYIETDDEVGLFCESCAENIRED